jgi:hypothetical protein
LSDVANEIFFSCNEGETVLANSVDSDFRCVHKSLVEEVDLGKTVWKSKNIANEGEIKAIGNGNQGFRNFPTSASSPGRENDADRLQFRLSNVPSPLYRDLLSVLTLSNPSAVEQKMTFSLERGLESTLTTEDTVSEEFRADFAQKFSFGAEGVAQSETAISLGYTGLTSSTISTSDVTSTTQTTTIEITVPAMSNANLAQLVVIDSQLGSSASATTLFTSNYALDIQPLNSTQLPAPGDNTSNLSGSSCDAVALDTKSIIARQDAANDRLTLMEQAITTTSDAILAESKKIQENGNIGEGGFER